MTETKTGQLTVFGATMLELMARRGVRQWKTLSDLLSEQGHDYKPARISNWAYGRHPVNRSFGRAFNEVLELGEEERHQLADAFLFGQEVYVGDQAAISLRNR